MSYADVLLSLLPSLHRTEDARFEDLPLATFLQVVGVPLDELKAAIDGIPGLVNVESCPEKFLPYLGALVGYSYVDGLDSDVQRRDIRETIERYRRKGTFTMLERELAAQGWTGEIVENHRFAVRLNRNAKLNQQKLPWRVYSQGVYQITDPLALDEFAATVAKHQPAGVILLAQ